MNIVFIADFFVEDILGGGELCNDELIKRLRQSFNVATFKSHKITLEFLQNNKENKYIIGNFLNLNIQCLKYIEENCFYLIYEHDHKYLKNRNPAAFKNFKAPNELVVNKSFYKSAKAVLCQSEFHAKIVQKNLNIDNIKALSCNLWSAGILEKMGQLSAANKKPKAAVLSSSISHKNTSGAIKYCQDNNIEYDLIKSSSYEEFLEILSQYETLIFLPLTSETFGRLAAEARMMNCKFITNGLVGVTYEKWFRGLKGEQLIEEIKQRQEEVVAEVVGLLKEDKVRFFSNRDFKPPKISIITSLYKGDEYLENYLENLTSQSIFDDCELIIVSGNSPGNEEKTIKEYQRQFPNILYKKLDYDPGIYGCWNVGLEVATGELVSNANLDDRRSLQQVEILAKELQENQDVDLVYSECFITNRPNERYNKNSSNGNIYAVADFSPENMIKCLPGCMPMWRRSIHNKIGVFDQEYKFAGDWEMWLRMVKNGAKFKRVDGTHGLYYLNPEGLTTSKAKEKEKLKEEKAVFHKYAEIFGQENYNRYKEYFSQ